MLPPGLFALRDQFRARAWSLLAGLVLLFGMAVRLRQYLGGRSLWLDEAWLALNIIHRDFAGLLQPLDDNQGAPILFLWALKGVSLLVGDGELALRLVPFLGSVAGCVLLYFVAGRYLSARYRLLAVTLFSLSVPLVYYAQELKQYSLDVAVLLALCLLFRPLLDGGRVSRGHCAALALIGAVATFLSHTAVFVLAGMSAVLLWQCVVLRSGPGFGTVAVLLGCWWGSFGLHYTMLLRHLDRSEYLHVFWQRDFLPLPVSLDAVRQWWTVWRRFLEYTGFQGWRVILASCLMAVAVLATVRRSNPMTQLLVFTVLAALGAALVGVYPFAHRLILFLVPVVLLLVVHGVSVVAGERLPVFLLGGAFLLLPFVQALPDLLAPIQREEARELLDTLHAVRRGDEEVYVYYGGQPAIRYCMRSRPEEMRNWHFGIKSRENTAAYLEDIARMVQYPKVWFLFVHDYAGEEAFFLHHIPGRLLEDYGAAGAHLYLFEFSPAPEN